MGEDWKGVVEAHNPQTLALTLVDGHGVAEFDGKLHSSKLKAHIC